MKRLDALGSDYPRHPRHELHHRGRQILGPRRLDDDPQVQLLQRRKRTELRGLGLGDGDVDETGLGQGPPGQQVALALGISVRSSSAVWTAISCSRHSTVRPTYRDGSDRTSAAVIPVSAPPAASSRSLSRTQPSSCTRAHSPSGPAPGPEPRSEPCRIGRPAGVAKSGSPARPPPGRGRPEAGRGGSCGGRQWRVPAGPLPACRPATPAEWRRRLGADGLLGTQPARLTWVHPPRVSSFRSRVPLRTRPITSPLGDSRMFSPSADARTTRSKPSRWVGAVELAEDPALDHYLVPVAPGPLGLHLGAGGKRDQRRPLPAPFAAGYRSKFHSDPGRTTEA